MSDVVYELLATETSHDKLAARNISPAEVQLVGETDGGRALTLVIERTVDSTTWLVVTGWSATAGERRLLGS